MSNRLFCSRVRLSAANSGLKTFLLGGALALAFLAVAPRAQAGSNAPDWMQALVNAPLPAHDEKTEAILLYSETNVTVESADRVRTTVREAYKILRPEGREYGTVKVLFHPWIKITHLRGWCIPTQGKDYEVKEKDATEISALGNSNDLVTDTKAMGLKIPAADPGSIVGYEYEEDEQPLLLQESWDFQPGVPVRESHFSLQIPAGWEYKTSWLNYPETKAVQTGNGAQWTLNNIKGIRHEEDMPPFTGVAGSMIVYLFPPGGVGARGFSNWQEMGIWQQSLASGRRDASPEIQQTVATLTASAATQLDKMRALAKFVQHDVRYVSIQLGIGGWQPHPAPEIFSHRYGDCKDKATLLSSMLHEIGINSYYVAINDERGSITPKSPAYLGFNHMILAIKLPDGLKDLTLVATMSHPKLGTLLFFDPTNEFIPLGQIPGYLQANYGLLVTPTGGELVELPQLPATMMGIQRTAKFVLSPTGALTGDVVETRLGDLASFERYSEQSATKNSDHIKPIEMMLSDSLANFRLTKATMTNLDHIDQPFGFHYSFIADKYAKNAGGLLLIRPRIIGTKSRGILETKEPRVFPIEFDSLERDSDEFDITLPAGFVVDDLPPPVDVDYDFGSYHAKTVANGNVLTYARTFELKQVTVPVDKLDELKKFYRIIADDERNTAVIKRQAN